MVLTRKSRPVQKNLCITRGERGYFHSLLSPAQLSFFFSFLLVFSEFPTGNTAITVGLMERLKPGTMLLFRFEVPRDQKQ
jgi:membrane-bound metal-dependent hydrolase YbcI (DUF457 family)